MKIDRDGIEIELTAGEIFSAYLEQEHEFDTSDIVDELYDRIGVADCVEDEIISRIGNNADLLSELAFRKRQLMDDDGISWDEATKSVVDNEIESQKTSSAKLGMEENL